ncbi:hypothetical protein C7458_103575 [Williamsia muralis]|nr:hypothetical protein C7458_103575 [Williamsia marianensis]
MRDRERLSLITLRNRPHGTRGPAGTSIRPTLSPKLGAKREVATAVTLPDNTVPYRNRISVVPFQIDSAADTQQMLTLKYSHLADEP